MHQQFVVPTTHALVPVNQPVVIAEAIDDYEEYGMAHHGHYHDDEKPVEMRLGNLAGMKVDVDETTRNAMATTFLGGLLVPLVPSCSRCSVARSPRERFSTLVRESGACRPLPITWRIIPCF